MTAQATLQQRRTGMSRATRRHILPRLLALHRWFGLVACIAVLMFASSGLLHPVMSRTQPQPLQRQAPVVQADASAVPLAAVLRDRGIDGFVAAGIVQLQDGAAYRVQVDDRSARYFAVADGSEIADGERRHAQWLARHFSGDAAAAIAESTEIREFDTDYLPVNRLLPAWRVRFERADGLTAYVDTRGNRLATLVDDRKRLLQTTFRNMHDFAFLDAQPWLRASVMLVLLGAACATALAGIAIFFSLQGSAARLQRSTTRRWHRRLALPIAATTLTFSVSGAWHLLQGEAAAAQPTHAQAASAFRAEELRAPAPPRAFTLLRVLDRPCYRLDGPLPKMADEHAHHHAPSHAAVDASPGAACIDAGSGVAVAHAEPDRAVELARHFSGNDGTIASVAQVNTFSGEYGFINKRLPVWRVVFANSSTRWYVETTSGALALRADDAAALEGFVFANVHKWTFFGDHKDIRDALMMLFASGNVAVALLGLWLFVRRPLGGGRY